MTLTVGSGPLGHEPGGRWSFAVPDGEVEYLEVFPRRIRALKNGETVVDTLDAMLLHRRGSLPVWCFPVRDVRRDSLAAGDTRTYEEGLARGLVDISWGAVDQWLEEDEEVIVHPRDPYHRVELRDTSRQVTISLDGETLAESTGAVAVFETSLPVRWYLPREDVQAELIDKDDLRTGCAYKGYAAYYDVRVGGRVEPFLCWSYQHPLDDVARLKGRICLFNERVDIDVDGVRQDRPRTPWSGTDWAQGDRRPPGQR